MIVYLTQYKSVGLVDLALGYTSVIHVVPKKKFVLLITLDGLFAIRLSVVIMRMFSNQIAYHLCL